MYVLFLTREQYQRMREIVGESLVERIELRNIGETIEQNPLDICQACTEPVEVMVSARPVVGGSGRTVPSGSSAPTAG